MTRINPIILVVLGLALSRTAGAQIQRQDFLIPGGVRRLHVREVRDHHNAKPRNLILLHGGGLGGLPSFDLPVAGYSLAADFAKRGFRVFVMDVRGCGSSTKPLEMDQPPQNSAPLVSTKEAADDIETVVGWVVRRTHKKTALLGWASGGHWACAYASRGPAALSAIILLNTLYSVNAPWELRPSMQEKEIQSSFIVMLVDTALWIEAGYCGAGMPPFQAQTRLNGVIRQWLMRTFGRRLERTRPPPRVIRRASEFRLVIKSMRSTFHLGGRSLQRKTSEFRC